MLKERFEKPLWSFYIILYFHHESGPIHCNYSESKPAQPQLETINILKPPFMSTQGFVFHTVSSNHKDLRPV